ncbi:hypothetical protein AZE42_00751, partial [Rhizopogon vesiculosus]|jgi:hypothetical protein
MDAT